MRIAFDFNPVVLNKFSGFYSFGTGLLKGFSTLSDSPEFLLFHSRRFHRQSQEAMAMFSDIGELKPTSLKMRWLENFWKYSNYPKLESLVGDFDIYHSLHHLMPPTRGKPRILTVHDLRRYKLPQFYKKSKLNRFEEAIKRADHFIAVSNSTKNDLCEFFEIPEKKIDVVHLAAGSDFELVDESKKIEIKKQLSAKFGIELNNYLITFSSPDKRKNIKRVIDAFISLLGKIPDSFKLVVVGSLPKNDKQLGKIDFDKICNNVIFAGQQENIKDLFACADGLIFASIYEGFGVPIVEAFASGTAVITSNISSMPEVAGEAALYVEPYSVESIADAICRLCRETDLRDKLVASGFERLKQFSWGKSAEKTLAIYNKLL